MGTGSSLTLRAPRWSPSRCPSAVAVRDRVVEGVGADEVGVGRVEPGAVGLLGERAVGGSELGEAESVSPSASVSFDSTPAGSMVSAVSSGVV